MLSHSQVRAEYLRDLVPYDMLSLSLDAFKLLESRFYFCH